MTTILLSVVGSQAYGLAEPSSDMDLRGVYVAPTRAFWRLDKPATSVEGPEPERLDWEVEHFCALALKANPTVLEALASQLVRISTPLGEQLRALLPAFLSRLAAGSFAHTARKQLHRALAAPQPKLKQIMHVIRLSEVALHLVRTGELSIVAHDRESLLAIRRGEVPVPEAEARAHDLLTDIGAAVAGSPLPEQPDRAAVEAWLVRVREVFL